MIDEKENKNEELEVNLEEVETEKEVNVPLNPLEKLQQQQQKCELCVCCRIAFAS